ncbi:unnamed protein product [Closterium sp. NIES-54]
MFSTHPLPLALCPLPYLLPFPSQGDTAAFAALEQQLTDVKLRLDRALHECSSLAGTSSGRAALGGTLGLDPSGNITMNMIPNSSSGGDLAALRLGLGSARRMGAGSYFPDAAGAAGGGAGRMGGEGGGKGGGGMGGAGDGLNLQVALERAPFMIAHLDTSLRYTWVFNHNLLVNQAQYKERLMALRAEMMVRSTTEKELRRAYELTEDAMRAKSMFLAIMSHEIRTPLNGILGLAEVLLESGALDEEQREIVETMMSSGVIISDILADILDLASMEAGEMKLEEHPFEPVAVVNHILKMAMAATKEKGIKVLADISPDIPAQILGDELRVRQVIKYLVLNAIKFTHTGHILLRVSAHDRDPSAAIVKATGAYAVGGWNVAGGGGAGGGGGGAGGSGAAATLGRGKGLAVEMHSHNKGARAGGSGRLPLLSDVTEEHLKKLASLGSLEQAAPLLAELPTEVYEEEEEEEDGDSERTRGEEEGGMLRPGGGGAGGGFWGSIVPAGGAEKGKGKAAAVERQIGGDMDVWLWCEVHDTGVGIPKDAFPLLFEKFTQVEGGPTRAYGGTGLGLAICKQLVELMHGKMAIKSKVGTGSVFAFSVCCQRTTPRSRPASPTGASAIAAAVNAPFGFPKSVSVSGPSPGSVARALSPVREHMGQVRGGMGGGEDEYTEEEEEEEEGDYESEYTDDSPIAITPKHLRQPRGAAAAAAGAGAAGAGVVGGGLAGLLARAKAMKGEVGGPGEGLSGGGASGAGALPGQRDGAALHAQAPGAASHSACGGVGLAPMPPHDPQPPIPPHTMPLLILLQVNVMVLLSMLKRLGLRATVAKNGVEALEAVRRERFDLLLSDLCMPLMDGLQAVKKERFDLLLSDLCMPLMDGLQVGVDSR